ncbi:CLUMA_CG018063, isoform A [Clunio marinus]|uniref:CLUMA_CG018063, isoform A n=1 Tax=Clunio marinus TaxID=568069 RepID=A0A1J1IZ21_9DIPT|nr:CLUMA_CG018063, isoform A [Clunio marinus]
MKRLCRVCLSLEGNEVFQPITENQCKISEELFYVCGVTVTDHLDYPALICCNCVIDVSNAARLKRIALVADAFFTKQIDLREEKSEIPTESYEELEISEEYVDQIIEYDDKMEMIEEYLDMAEDSNHDEVPVKPQKQNKSLPKPVKRNRIHKCECGKDFTSSQRLSDHIRTKHDIIPESEYFSCSFCDKKFKLQSYLDFHIRNLHSNNPLKKRQKNPCSYCGKLLSSKSSLKHHEERHFLASQPLDEIKKFICDTCGQKFRLKSYIFNHIHNVHIRKKYTCSFCQQGFYKKYEVNDHIRQYHTMERPFECEFEGCTKTFSRKKNLLIHRRIHTGERPYSCTESQDTDPRCPPNNDITVHLPHEYNCSVFYKCNWGVPVLFDCEPPGTHWSVELDWCDWPERANCTLSGIPPGDDTTNLVTTTESLPPATSPSPDPRCPPNNDITVHLPHEYNCSVFYKCNWGVPVLFDCEPPGTHWSVELDWCDWPERANCTLTGIPPGDDTTNLVTTTESLPPATSPSPDHDPRCPWVEDPENPVHIPHPYDCELFFICDNGRLVLNQCSGGTHWSVIHDRCEWPHIAECDPNTNIDERCSIEDELAFIPHEYDCEKFYACNQGIISVHRCEEGRHFNPRSNQCDSPSIARCELSGSTTTTMMTETTEEETTLVESTEESTTEVTLATAPTVWPTLATAPTVFQRLPTTPSRKYF